MVTPQLGERVGCIVTPPIEERVGCMVTSRWGRGWVTWLLPAGGEGRLHGYFPLGEWVN